VDGLDTRDQPAVWQVRQRVGMVFQNPDNQLVATVVEEDVAFGPENLGLPPAEIRRRVEEALRVVEMGSTGTTRRTSSREGRSSAWPSRGSWRCGRCA